MKNTPKTKALTFIKSLRLSSGLLLYSGLILLSGCTISTIYLTPTIKGTVIDVASLTPAANVIGDSTI